MKKPELFEARAHWLEEKMQKHYLRRLARPTGKSSSFRPAITTWVIGIKLLLSEGQYV